MKKRQKKAMDAMIERLADLDSDLRSTDVEAFAHDLAKIDMLPGRLNICTHGICGDFLVEFKTLGGLTGSSELMGRLGRIEAFPFGIVNPDHVMVQAEFKVDR